ncbi:hypothetical protein [Nocardia wallacei]|uniref:hypothetical protein n=1 Tax=Nocardia wallacei TaxID=480035 RepID=UPI002454CED0|nr:hypothetical protein [Nocardia wallacei]
MAPGDDDAVHGDGVSPSRSALAPSENTVRIAPSEPQVGGTAPARTSRWSRLWRQRLGRLRVSTMVLVSVWVAVLVLYLQVRPGG